MKNWILTGLMLTTMPLAAVAQDMDTNRFRLETADGGFVLLDTQTGALSLCRSNGDTLVCRTAAKENSVYQDTLLKLQRRVTALENSLAEAKTAQKPIESAPPTELEIDQGFTILEKIMRRFMNLAEELDKQAPEPDSYPQKT